MIELTAKQRKFLEKKAQPLSALVQVGGAGLTEEQVKNINNIFKSHELIKIKYNVIKSLAMAEERAEVADARNTLDSDIEQNTNSTHVRTIGNVAIFYKAAEKADDQEFEADLKKLAK
ncbi:MAG: YhbY family RNA-binding protein [Treponema sp.]|nr:YhbY family RNA-binding protein [Candidatus Treponema equifaecale]